MYLAECMLLDHATLIGILRELSTTSCRKPDAGGPRLLEISGKRVPVLIVLPSFMVWHK